MISANEDLIQIKKYISTDNEFYAKKVINSILYTINRQLLYFPKIWKEVDKLENLREIIETNYKFRIIYMIDWNNIHIISIFKHRNI